MIHFNFEVCIHLLSCTPLLFRWKMFGKSPKWRNKGVCECRIFVQIGFRKRPPSNCNFHGHLQKKYILQDTMFHVLIE